MSQNEKVEALSVEDEMAALLKEKAERVKARATGQRASALERLRLESRFERDAGPEGQAFNIVDATDTGDGFLVVTLGDSIDWTRFKASKMTDADTYDFVIGNIAIPDVEAFKRTIATKPFIADRCANALSKLYGFKAEQDEGK
jgi:hypothetical protein